MRQIKENDVRGSFSEMPRRSFLKTVLAGAAGTIYIPRLLVGQAVGTANSRLQLAFVGCGGASRGRLKLDGVDFVALCDVNASSIAARKAEIPALSAAREFSDYRRMFDAMGDSIDGVMVVTPDHWHYAITMEAMLRGKHVYTEKPLTFTIWQARTLAKMAARNPNIKTVMGNQGHTFNGIREMREWYEAGILGQVSEVDAWFPGPRWGSPFFRKPNVFPPPAQPVPDGLDWEMWVGPNEMVPHSPLYSGSSWRGFWNFGTGMLGDWFPHIADGPVWILDLYEPSVIESEKIVGPNEGMCPDGSVTRFDFPARHGKAACTLRWYDGGEQPEIPSDWSWSGRNDEDGKSSKPAHGSLWTAENGSFYLDERSNNPRLTSREKTIELKNSGALPGPKYPRVPRGGPAAEWVRAIQGEGPDPGSNFGYGAKLTEIALLGVLAQRFGGRIEWDATNMRITNRPELNHYLNPPVRKGWEYVEELWEA
jgi:predicted dehydrogenase